MFNVTLPSFVYLKYSTIQPVFLFFTLFFLWRLHIFSSFSFSCMFIITYYLYICQIFAQYITVRTFSSYISICIKSPTGITLDEQMGAIYLSLLVEVRGGNGRAAEVGVLLEGIGDLDELRLDRKSTRLNSRHT